MQSSRSLLVVAALTCTAAAACAPAVDLKEAVELTETSGGWFDSGLVDGKNRLVPSVSFRLRKKGDAALERLALNVVFRKVPLAGTNTEEEFDEIYVQATEFSEGRQSPLVTVRADTGYTGDPPQSRMDILQHSQFRDMRARVFAKHGGSQWVELGVIEIPRQLLTR